MASVLWLCRTMIFLGSKHSDTERGSMSGYQHLTVKRSNGSLTAMALGGQKGALPAPCHCYRGPQQEEVFPLDFPRRMKRALLLAWQQPSQRPSQLTNDKPLHLKHPVSPTGFCLWQPFQTPHLPLEKRVPLLCSPC